MYKFLNRYSTNKKKKCYFELRKIVHLEEDSKLYVMQVCSGNDYSFVVINQKGIDPPSLDLLARAGVSSPWNLSLLLFTGCGCISVLLVIS